MKIVSMIDGLSIFELHQIVDERGAVLHMLRNDAADFTRFGECYFSEVLPGAIKAWKCHHAQTQNLTVPVGRIRMVIYDNRESSKTIGNLQILEVGRPDMYYRVKIAPGLWYGFSCISSNPALLANCPDLPHDPTDSDVIPFNNSTIPYDWVANE